MLPMRATGTYSTAPADVLATVALSETLRRFGIRMPCTPVASAVRKSAPRLCGSSSSSSRTRNGALSLRLRRLEDVLELGIGDGRDVGEHALMAMAAGERLDLRALHVLHDDAALFASAAISATEPSRSPLAIQSLLMPRPDFSASVTALRPTSTSSGSSRGSSRRFGSVSA